MNKNQTPLVIKLGGAALESSDILSQFFTEIKNYQKTTQKHIVILHGGGCYVDDLMAKLNLATVKKNGLRVTPFEHIPFITGALAGTANKLLQAKAIAQGIQAVGLSLADGNLCEVTQLNSELGAVGLAFAGAPHFLQSALNLNLLPIIIANPVKYGMINEFHCFGLASRELLAQSLLSEKLKNTRKLYVKISQFCYSSIGITKNGELMNVNADQAAVAIAKALNAELVLLSDVEGVLNENKQLIPLLTQAKVQALIENQVITDGMIVKVEAALQAAKDLGRAIQIASWKSPEKLNVLFAGENIGMIFE